nr:ribonuclease H-like domain-containing protein [Tanacetum cinerariifolium]
MTDYSLWEVILNGDSPTLTRIINGVLQHVAPTTAKQRLARKNELKARGTLLMALPDKHQLKFNTYKDAKTLMEAIEKRFGGNTKTKKKLISQLEILRVSLSQEDINLKFLRSLPTGWRTHTLIWSNKIDLEEQSLDNLFNSLKIYEAEVKSSSSTSTSTQNISFMSSSNTDGTNEPFSADIDADVLEEMDLKCKMAMLTVRARRFLQRTGRNLGANEPIYIGFDMSKVECYNYHRKGHFTRERIYDWSFQADEEPTNYALMAFSSSSSSSDNESDESLPPSPIYDRYHSGNGYHVVPSPYIGTFMPPTPDLVFNTAPNDVETIHTAFNDELSPTKLDNDFIVQPTSQIKSPRTFVQHIEISILTANPKTAIPKPTSNGKRRNRKASFVCKSLDHLIKDYDYHEKKMAQTPLRNLAPRGHHQHYARMPLLNPQRHMVPTAVVPKSKHVPINAARPITADVHKIKVTRPKQEKPIVTKPNSPPRRHINCSTSPKASNFPPKHTAVKAPMVNAAKEIQVSNGLGPKKKLTILFLVLGNPQHALKDKGVIDSGCSRHMTRNMSYLFDFEELNGGYVAFGGNPKGGKISGKGKIKIGKIDFDDVYFVKELKFNLFSVSQMCDKKNSVLFTETECLVLSPEFKLPDDNQVLLRVPRENNMYNVNLKNIVPSGDLTCLFAKATLDESNLWLKGWVILISKP